jgi:serine/threonine-protein kinase
MVLCGRYALERHLASGGMGEVWQATDTELGRRVAVKLLHPHLSGDPDVVARFRREARAAARLHHPAIVAVYDTCNDAGREAIVLQLIDGPSLRQYLDRVGRLSDDQTITIATSVAEGLGVAHAAGLVHRDIKPANILFGDQRAMVTDFGVAKALDEVDTTTTGTLLGSVRYLCPEQVEGTTPDGRGDLFSLGVVLYECVTGTTPWQGSTAAATALARLDQPLVPPGQLNPAMSAGLDHVITTLLARSPDDRYPNAAALVQALHALSGNAAVPMPAPPGVNPSVGDDLEDLTNAQWMADPTEAALAPATSSDDRTTHDDIADDSPHDSDEHDSDEHEHDHDRWHQDDDWDDDWDDEHDFSDSRRRRRMGHLLITLLVVISVAVIFALVNGTDAARLITGQ